MSMREDSNCAGSDQLSASNQQTHANACNQAQAVAYDHRTTEQVMVDMIREDLGVSINPQAWRMFIRNRFSRISPLAHRIHEGKR